MEKMSENNDLLNKFRRLKEKKDKEESKDYTIEDKINNFLTDLDKEIKLFHRSINKKLSRFIKKYKQDINNIKINIRSRNYKNNIPTIKELRKSKE
jgi:hypothetical protein